MLSLTSGCIAFSARVALIAVIAMLATFVSASAHEHREVGKYEFVVGFQNEPAYVNQPNGVLGINPRGSAHRSRCGRGGRGRADRGVGEDPEGNGAAGRRDDACNAACSLR